MSLGLKGLTQHFDIENILTDGLLVNSLIHLNVIKSFSC